MNLQAGAGGTSNDEYQGDSVGLNDPTGIPFAIENENYRFTPAYYPERFTDTQQNEVKRKAQQCDGEDVYIDGKKNADIHITGIVLAENLTLLRRLRDSSKPVDIISPKAENGGIEAVIEKAKIGDIVGWDQFEHQWQFNYTLDLVSTGRDESDGKTNNQIVSELVEVEDKKNLL